MFVRVLTIINWFSAGPTTQVLTASPVMHDPLRASGHLAEGGSASGYMVSFCFVSF